MTKKYRCKRVFVFSVLVTTLLILPATAVEIPSRLPDPEGKPADMSRPVKVSILLGQSNMLGFGHVVGYLLDEPVLVLKACIGNRSLGWDLLPPGSERYEFEGRTYAGYKDTPGSWVEGEPRRERDHD